MLGVYTFNQDFAGHKAGDRVELTDEEAKALKDFVDEAEREEDKEDEHEEEEAPHQAAAITRAVDKLSKDLNKSVAKAAELAVSKVAGNKAMPPVYAEPKQEIFKSAGHMLYHVWRAKSFSDIRSRKMLDAYQSEISQKTSPVGSNETTSSQGGYVVKPEWLYADKVREYPDLIARTKRMPVSGNSLNVPSISEASLADGVRHGGVLSYWTAEGDTASASFPSFGQTTLTLGTNISLVVVTNQLLQDANVTGFDTLIRDMVSKEMKWQENDAVCGVGDAPAGCGIINSAALVTVTKSSGTSNAQIGFDDLAKMERALYSPCRANAAFLVTPEARAQLVQQSFVTYSGTATSYPARGIQFDFSNEFPMRWMGYPIIEVNNLPQLGLKGDVLLADLSQLITAEKPGIEADISTEFYFNTLQTAFRFVRRYMVKSFWLSTLGSKDTNYTYGPFVALSARGT